MSRTGGWMWIRAARPGDLAATHSSRTFSTLADCIADAERYGYMPKAPAERGRGSGSLLPP